MDTNPLLVHCINPPHPLQRVHSSYPGMGLVGGSFSLFKNHQAASEASFGSDGNFSQRQMCLCLCLLSFVFMGTMSRTADLPCLHCQLSKLEPCLNQ